MNPAAYPTDNPEEQDLRTFVGPRADDYLKYCKIAAPNHYQSSDFNWAALIVPGLWLPYRKMYKITVIFYAVILAELVAEELLFVAVLGMPESPAVLDAIVAIVTASVCGLYGNRWYRSHARKVIAAVRRQALGEPEFSEVLKQRGGVSVVGSLVSFLLFLVVDFAVLLILEIALHPV
ncbi:MAG: DUF2628 domain-containing protein [Gammaproteobacteria bacterium]